MIFVFDLDDTICETDSYSEKYISEFFKANNLPYKKIASCTRFAEKKFDWDTQTALNWYKEHGDKMMEEFPCKKDAVETINNLYDNGHTIIFATARANDWHKDPEKATLNWLKKTKIKYNKLYIGRVDKETICEEENADIFIDDDIKITQKVAEYFKSTNSKQKKVFLMTTNYNKTLEPSPFVTRVLNFKDFINKINKED